MRTCRTLGAIGRAHAADLRRVNRQDQRNREGFEKGRTGRFEPFLSGEEQQARARRGTSKR